MAKIPIRIDWIGDGEGIGDAEITMDLGYFESSGTSIRSDIRRFKQDYLEAIRQAREADASGDGKRPLSARRRWRACRILSDFNQKASNKFVVTNYKEAYARDFGIPPRSIRTYLDFGRSFEENEVVDQIPYSIYAELVFKMRGLRARGLFDLEKAQLIKMGMNGNPPMRDEYRKRLKGLIDSTGSSTGAQ